MCNALSSYHHREMCFTNLIININVYMNTLVLTLVNNKFFQFAFSCSSFNNALVNSVGSHKPINHHWPRLSDAMTAILSLKVTLRILKSLTSIFFHLHDYANAYSLDD